MPRQTSPVDIDQMIVALPRNEQLLVRKLRTLIAECIPLATENAYDGLCMPFYKRNRLICFILPPSVSFEPKGGHEKLSVDVGGATEKGVALGFNQGNLMSNENGMLKAEGRKQVYAAYFKKLDDIDESQVRALLFEAAMIDEQFAKKKRK